jgi:hypothetical protein
MATITQALIDTFSDSSLTLRVSYQDAYVGQNYMDGDTFTAVADSGVSIESIATDGGYDAVTGGYPEYQWNVSNDGSSATFDYVAGSYLSYSVIETGIAVVGLNVTQEMLDAYNASNVVLDVDGVTASLGDLITIGSTVGITALDGFTILSAIIYGSYDPGSGTTPEWEFSINADGDYGTLLYDDSGMDNGLINPTNIIVEEKTEIVSGTNSVYIVNAEIIEEINNNRFIPDGSTTIDYGQYILSIISIPTQIEPSLISETKRNVLGLGGNTLADVVLTDLIPVDMGSITIPEIYNDSRDFSRTDCVLHLPYSQPVAIDSEYVIGQTLSVEYLIDAYNASATINISSTKVNEVFLTKNTTLGFNVPYALNKTDSANLENSNIDIGGNNKISKCFIEIIKNEAILSDGVFTTSILDEDSIINHTGFIKVEEIELNISANYSEKQSVIDALTAGVIIK